MYHHDCRIRAASRFTGRQWVHADHPPNAVAAADQMPTDSYSKLHSNQLGPYCLISSAAEIVTIDKEGIPNTISSDQALRALQQEIDAYATGPYASQQLEYGEGLLAEYSTTEMPIDSSNAGRRSSTGITRPPGKIEHEEISDHVKCTKKIWKTTLNTGSTTLSVMLVKAQIWVCHEMARLYCSWWLHWDERKHIKELHNRRLRIGEKAWRCNRSNKEFGK